MQPQNRKSIPTAFLVLCSILSALLFQHSPGTSDVNIWQQWAYHVDTYGVVQGYQFNHADYPPLSSVVIFCAVRVGRLLDMVAFSSIKWSIILFLFFTTFLFWFWTKDLYTTLMLHFALLLNSVALGYIDIYFAPFLVLSFWALKQRKLALFSVFFAIACLTKWQPLIIAPFIVLYILDLRQAERWKLSSLLRIFIRLLAPGAVLLGLTLSIFGFSPTWEAFRASLSHHYLSGNALNFNWILTHFLHVLKPGEFGGLIEGQANYIVTDSLQITLFSRLLFYAFYFIILVRFFRAEKSFENLIVFSVIGFLAYFTFNIGVHENHLFLVTILGVALLWLNKNTVTSVLTLVLMNNINLFLFYGIDGKLRFSRVVGGIDTALLFSIFNVGFILYWLMQIIYPGKPASLEV